MIDLSVMRSTMSTAISLGFIHSKNGGEDSRMAPSNVLNAMLNTDLNVELTAGENGKLRYMSVEGQLGQLIPARLLLDGMKDWDGPMVWNLVESRIISGDRYKHNYELKPPEVSDG